MSRADFWEYCLRTGKGIEARSMKIGLPCDVDRYFIDELFVRQKYKCAISGIDFEPPKKGQKRSAFGPSLDRIVPSLGYTKGNVRLVCTMVNLAMSDWGEDNFFRLVSAMAGTVGERSSEIFQTLREKSQRNQRRDTLIHTVSSRNIKDLQESWRLKWLKIRQRPAC